MRDSLVFYRSFYEAVKDLNPEEFKDCVSAIMEYGLDDIDDASGIANTVLKLVKPQIDANNRRFENGKKGGRTKAEPNETKTEPNLTKVEPNLTKSEPNVNVNVNENVNDIEKEKVKKNPVDDSDLPDGVKDTVRDWLRYKSERRESYKDMGLKSLITQIDNKVKEHGEQAVINVIRLSMSQGWKGIIWDKIPQNKAAPYKSFTQREYDFDELERGILSN